MKRFFLFALFIALGMLQTQEAAGQRSSLTFGKYKIEGIRITSMRTAEGSVSVVTTNSDKTFTMSEISGTVNKKGRPFVSGTARPVTVPSGTTKVVVNGDATLCDGVTLMDVLGCIAFRPSDYTVDVHMKISNSDSTRVYDKKGVSLSRLLGNIRD